jgi:hypothetical protein
MGPYQIAYLPLDIHQDTTEGFTREGIVKLALPHPERLSLPPNSVDEDRYAGTGNRPPRIDDEDVAKRLVSWIRLRPKRFTEGPALRWLGVNAVGVDQLRTVENVVIATADGSPDQVFQLPSGSIDEESFHLEVEETDRGYQRWHRHALHAATRNDRVFELDGEAGLVKFGDGLRGTVPEAGRRIRVVRMRYGGGAQGNVEAGNLTTISHPLLKLIQSVAMAGGADPETLENAEKRIPSELRHRDRAVTAKDYREIALKTPAVELARVEVLPKFKPQQRRPNVVGVMSVMVLPRVVERFPPNPRPDRNMLSRVHAYLEERRPIGVELYVIGTEYVPIGLSVAVGIRDGYPRNEVLASVGEALRDHLWPLSPGGHDAQGWPLGRAVVGQQLEVIVARVAGVLTVNDVNLFGLNPNHEWEIVSEQVGKHEVRLEEWQLPELLTVVAIDGFEAPRILDEALATGPGERPGEGRPGAGDAGTQAIPIPVVPDVCR